LFRLCDHDKDGLVNLEDLRSFLQDLNAPSSAGDAAALLAHADKDGRGALDFEAFSALMSSTNLTR
jgi:Ca2+-binding EF-hand superfamily protein